MPNLHIITHTPDEIKVFAKEVGIPIELAEKTEQKREWHIFWEYGYIKKDKEKAVA